MTEITKKDFEKLNLRVGKIKAVKPHPKTKDYVLLISLGPAGTEKQLVADLKEGYTKEELVGKQVLFVQNMEPITVKGVESIGLLLVTHKNEKPVLVQPDKKVETSSLVKEEKSASSGKGIVIMMLVLIGIFALFIGGSYVYNKLTSADVVNIDQLHEQNLEEKLDEETGYVYNGYSFVKADGLWWTEIHIREMNLNIPLHFGPKEVEFVPMKGTMDPAFNIGENMYIAIDPTTADKYYTLATSELSFNIAKGINRIPVGSCTEENYICENRTIVSCENTQGKPVVELALAEETRIDISGTCIKVSGSGYGIVKAVDRLLYHWYGIMD